MISQRMSHVCCVIVAASLSALPAAAAEPPKVAQKWALLIGVDDYAYANDLNFCGADQQALAARLKGSGFTDEQIFLLHDKAEESAYRPSRGNIERQLGLVLGLAQPDDLIVVSFSGHGVSFGGKSYLCPGDATLDDPATLISLDQVYERLRDCAATFKLVLVDACRNDPRVGGARSLTATDSTKALARSFQEMRLPEGVVLLNSCAPGEISQEDTKLGHGVYMHFVLEGLGGAADKNTDGQVSLYELQAYADLKTRTHVARNFHSSQRPFYKVEGEGALMEYALLPIGPGGIQIPGGDGKPLTNGIGMKLALIPAGEFLMGSPESDSDASGDEKPQHRVRITKPYYLGITEVTQGQWEAVMGTRPWSRFDHVREGANYPATYISWDDATEFCRKLSTREGKQYRLPTEAEWEYACRAGATTKYSFGDDASRLGDYAWFDGNAWDIGEKYAHFVATKRPNGFGLYDMHGNVWEWCDDWYHESAYSISHVDDPAGISGSSYRVNRGGSWSGVPSNCRSADRFGSSPGIRYSVLGFRVALLP